MQSKTIIVDNLKINYIQSEGFNKDEALIFLHGWKSQGSHFAAVLEYCKSYIALDLPGFGTSQQPSEVWGVEEYADFLKKFLEKLQIEKPILVGHSFGGAIIIQYVSAGNEVKKVILIDSAGIRELGSKILIYKIMAKIGKVFFLIPLLSFFKGKIRKSLYKTIDSEDYIEAGAMTDIYKKVIRQDLSEKMNQVNVETTLLWGRNDTATPLWQGERIASRISDAKLIIIENAGHFPFVDQPQKFKEQFIKEITC